MKTGQFRKTLFAGALILILLYGGMAVLAEPDQLIHHARQLAARDQRHLQLASTAGT